MTMRLSGLVLLLWLCGGTVSAAPTRDPALHLSTVPRRVLKTADSDKYGTESFDLVLVDQQHRALEPVRATINLMSKGIVLKSLVLERGGLQSIRHSRYLLNDKVPKASPRRHFSLPEAFDLGLYFSEPRSAGVDSVHITLTVADGPNPPLTQELGLPLSTYAPKTSLIFPLVGPALVTQGRYNQGGHVNRSTMYAMDIMGVSTTSYGPMVRDADSADAVVGWGMNVIAPAAGVVTYARNACRPIATSTGRTSRCFRRYPIPSGRRTATAW
jgi:hypothetical protein